MKHYITLAILLVFGFGLVSAKTDYKNPIASKIMAELIITKDNYKTYDRNLSLAVDKYGNCFISINVNYFKKKGRDDLQIKVNGKDYRIKLAKSIRVKAYSFYPENPTYTITTSTFKIGNTYTTHSTINKQKYDYWSFYSIYPISQDLCLEIINNGIEAVAVDGIKSITIK